MNDPATLSRVDLLELIERKSDRLQQQDAELRTKDTGLETKDAELQSKDAELQAQDAQLQIKTNIIEQLEQKNKGCSPESVGVNRCSNGKSTDWIF